MEKIFVVRPLFPKKSSIGSTESRPTFFPDATDAPTQRFIAVYIYLQ